MSFGNRLQTLLKSKKISQEKLAELLNVAGKSTISAWINDRAKPNADLLVKLSEILSTTPNHLLLGGEQESEIETLKRENDLMREALEAYRRAEKAEKELKEAKNIEVVLNKA
ncbi:hypothetical protein GCM10011514_06080 [Emticicia aquatilis]|uniref:HTH cro/C1-type domain-containing protein n=1 Tax=Emticicia aquatilis TaxID=1537369 RepID=A0A916YHD9_9BACT|nr:helix-turn-helix transcriptional regulator [Emticicia aquatilis]GGD44855.1 hypothetical protein GCM10011514_06080 [Emticicia aquatilis]